MFDIEKALKSALETAEKAEPLTAEPLTPERLKFEMGRRQVALAASEMANGTDAEFEVERMAEGFMLQGDFETAMELSKSRKPLYRKLIAQRDNPCDCPQRFVTDRFCDRAGQIITIYQCLNHF